VLVLLGQSGTLLLLAAELGLHLQLQHLDVLPLQGRLVLHRQNPMQVLQSEVRQNHPIPLGPPQAAVLHQTLAATLLQLLPRRVSAVLMLLTVCCWPGS
jgi:hypothetical protein